MAAVPPPGSPGTGQQAGPKQIYDELIRQGASTVQAIGIMANMINESGLNVETGHGGTAIDNNGYPVYGLVSWNTASYPNAGSLVTGNPTQDLKAQVTYLIQTGGLTAASGSTYAETAGNFAANYEKCVGCDSGGAQYNERVANASTVAGWASSGDWPVQTEQATSTAQTNTSAATADTAACLVRWPAFKPLIIVGPNVGGGCLLSKTNARAFISAGILVGGAILGIFGVVVILSTFSGTQELAGKLLAVVPGVGAVGAVVEAAPEPKPAPAAENPQRSRYAVRPSSQGPPE